MTKIQGNTYNDDFLYQVLKNRDRRFDGRFFFGTTTTGVYCRPICPVRRPKRENYLFFESAAKAEKAGFRPCLRCHPEFAPAEGHDPDGMRIVTLAANLLRGDGDFSEGGMHEVSDRLGVSDRHLRRLFVEHYGVSPIQYAQTQRLLFARKLIFETDLSFTQIAMAANFGSVRRMNALFHERYGCNPTQMRRGKRTEGGDIILRIPYSPPYAWREMLEYLSACAVRGVEEVTDDAYRRTVSIFAKGQWYRGWLAIKDDAENAALLVQLDQTLVPVLATVVARLKRLFDTDCRPADSEGALRGLCGKRPGLRLPGCFDTFEIAVRVVLGTVVAEGISTLGEPIETPFSALRRLFPSPDEAVVLSQGALREAGITEAESNTMRCIADAARKGALDAGADIEAQIAHLATLPGVDAHAAQKIAMHALDWPDAFSPLEPCVRESFPGKSTDEILAAAEIWRPWRAYATMHLWHETNHHTT